MKETQPIRLKSAMYIVRVRIDKDSITYYYNLSDEQLDSFKNKAYHVVF